MNDLNVACFLSVVRTLSFAISAKEFYITQQAVSRNIQSLENELGVLLFHRHYHSVRLTHAGEEFYKAFDEMSQKRFIYSKTIGDDNSSKSLRVGYTSWSGMPANLNTRIDEFARQSRESLYISLVEASDREIFDYLNTGEIEVALIPRYIADNFGDGFTALPIAEIPLYIVIEVDHPLISLSQTSIALSNLPHIACRATETDDEAVKWRVHREYIDLDFYPKSIRVLPNPESVFTEVLMGNGITFSPDNRFTKCEDLAIFPLPRTVTICAVRLHQNENSHVFAFEKYLTDKSADIT